MENNKNIVYETFLADMQDDSATGYASGPSDDPNNYSSFKSSNYFKKSGGARISTALTLAGLIGASALFGAFQRDAPLATNASMAGAKAAAAQYQPSTNGPHSSVGGNTNGVPDESAFGTNRVPDVATAPDLTPDQDDDSKLKEAEKQKSLEFLSQASGAIAPAFLTNNSTPKNYGLLNGFDDLTTEEKTAYSPDLIQELNSGYSFAMSDGVAELRDQINEGLVLNSLQDAYDRISTSAEGESITDLRKRIDQQRGDNIPLTNGSVDARAAEMGFTNTADDGRTLYDSPGSDFKDWNRVKKWGRDKWDDPNTGTAADPIIEEYTKPQALAMANAYGEAGRILSQIKHDATFTGENVTSDTIDDIFNTHLPQLETIKRHDYRGPVSTALGQKHVSNRDLDDNLNTVDMWKAAFDTRQRVLHKDGTFLEVEDGKFATAIKGVGTSVLKTIPSVINDITRVTHNAVGDTPLKYVTGPIDWAGHTLNDVSDYATSIPADIVEGVDQIFNGDEAVTVVDHTSDILNNRTTLGGHWWGAYQSGFGTLRAATLILPATKSGSSTSSSGGGSHPTTGTGGWGDQGGIIN